MQSDRGVLQSPQKNKGDKLNKNFSTSSVKI